MNAPAEFIVNGFLEGFAGELQVIGRCGDAPIRVGEVFDRVRDKVDGELPVKLEVAAIHAYGRLLAELGIGMTGTLDVRGEGVDLLRPSSVLVVKGSNGAMASASPVSAATGAPGV